MIDVPEISSLYVFFLGTSNLKSWDDVWRNYNLGKSKDRPHSSALFIRVSKLCYFNIANY